MRSDSALGTLDGALMTTNIDVFLRICEYARLKTVHPPTLPTGRIAERYWAACTRAGDPEILRWVFSTYPPRGSFRYNLLGYPLELAAGIGNSQGLQVLMDYTAPMGKVRGLVSHAAAGGHFDLVKMLVEQGYDMNEPGDHCHNQGRRAWNFPHALPPPIVSAVELEHLRMFRFLRDGGAVFNTPETCGEAVGRAKAAGLDSMLKLLAQEGVDLDRFPPFCKKERLCERCT